MITASLKNHRIAPRKVRLIADMIRGKSVASARIILTNAAKKAKHPLRDLLDSAVANAAHNHKLDTDALFVKEIRVDQGLVMKRFMPVSRGSASGFKKRTSNVSITLAEGGKKQGAGSKEKVTAKKASVSKSK